MTNTLFHTEALAFERTQDKQWLGQRVLVVHTTEKWRNEAVREATRHVVGHVVQTPDSVFGQVTYNRHHGEDYAIPHAPVFVVRPEQTKPGYLLPDMIVPVDDLSFTINLHPELPGQRPRL